MLGPQAQGRLNGKVVGRVRLPPPFQMKTFSMFGILHRGYMMLSYGIGRVFRRNSNQERAEV